MPDEAGGGEALSKWKAGLAKTRALNGAAAGLAQVRLKESAVEALKRAKEEAREAREAAQSPEDAKEAPRSPLMRRASEISDAMLGRTWRSSGMLLGTATGAALAAKRERGDVLSWRESLYLLVNEPASGMAAFWWGRLMQGLLIISALATTYETTTFVNSLTGPAVWMYMKLGLNALFTIEALLRIISSIPLRTACRNHYIWLDIMTVMPVYVRLLLAPTSFSPESASIMACALSWPVPRAATAAAARTMHTR